MIVSVHLAEVGWAAVPRILRGKSALTEVAGLRYAESAVTAPLSESLLPSPRLGGVGLIASWEDDAALDEFSAGHPLAEQLSGGWHVRLEPLHAYGSWSGMPDLPAQELPIADGEPVAVLTLGQLRLRRARPFLRASARAEGEPIPRCWPRLALPVRPGWWRRSRSGEAPRRCATTPAASARGRTRLQPGPTGRSRSIMSPRSCASGRTPRWAAGASAATRSRSPPRQPESFGSRGAGPRWR
jgi:hypothetical protein